VLATVPLAAGDDEVRESTVLQARMLGATDEEMVSAAAVVTALLRHPVFDRARAADAKGACRRETPVALTEPGGIFIEGIVDLAFEENDRWVVVDFKTDQQIGERLDAYMTQVRLYADIIAEATGQPAAGLLVKI
jgi:ATP-dependent exoDNAse (exonuclease V) beta subunit